MVAKGSLRAWHPEDQAERKLLVTRYMTLVSHRNQHLMWQWRRKRPAELSSVGPFLVPLLRKHGMIAISNWNYFCLAYQGLTRNRTSDSHTGFRHRLLQCIAIALLTLALSHDGFSQGTTFTKAQAEAQAKKAYNGAQAKWQQNPNDPELGWKFARACFDWADLADTSKQRADLASQGIEACRPALKENTQLGPAH